MAPVAAPQRVPSGGRYPELDSHRGIAVLAMVVFTVYQFCNVDHFLYRGTFAYQLFNSLDAAVPWLFVLTAFTLFTPIARSAIDGASGVSARGFLSRRAVSLIPVYYVAVLVVWFVRQDSLPGDWRDLIEHLTFTQVFDEKRIFYTNGPAWAVSVIVFFFLLLAALSAVLPRICRTLASRRRRIAVLVGVTVVLGAVASIWKAYSFALGHRSTTGSFTTWFGPIANLDSFAIGMALAVLVAVWGDVRPRTPRGRAVLRVAAVAILFTAFATRVAGSWSAVYFNTECSLGFVCLVAAAVVGPAGPPGDRRNRRRWRPLAWLGAISYSTYLWHEPVLLAMNGWHGVVRQAPDAFAQDSAVVLITSVLAGWLSYLLIECPTKGLAALLGRDVHPPVFPVRHNPITPVDVLQGPPGCSSTLH